MRKEASSEHASHLKLSSQEISAGNMKDIVRKPGDRSCLNLLIITNNSSNLWSMETLQ